MPCLSEPTNYHRFSVCFLSPGVSYPPVSTVVCWNEIKNGDGDNHSLSSSPPAQPDRVGLNIPGIELLAIWVGGMHCVIVTKLCGAPFFWGGGF